MYVVGQIVRMKKGHPCGGDAWRIIRVGMDFRIKCLKCGHSVLLPRQRFERKVKEALTTGTEAGQTPMPPPAAPSDDENMQ